MKINKPTIPPDTRVHIASHFDSRLPGSKFYEKSPDLILDKLLKEFPDAFIYSKPDADKRIRIQFKLSEPIGESSVVNVEELTDEERASVYMIERNGTFVRCIKTSRSIPTCYCCSIFNSKWQLITMFPGKMAPPLPTSPEIHDEYWDNHVFLEPTVIL